MKMELNKNIINKKNINSIWLGIKKGYKLDPLPNKVRLFLELPAVRILRVIGGLCTIFYLFHKNGIITYNLPFNLNYVVYIMAALQFVQVSLISILKLVYGLNILIYHREKFEIRNSPINRLASIMTNIAFCWKTGCQVGSTGVGMLGSSMIIDSALDAAGKEKIFEPYLNRILQVIGGARGGVLESIPNTVDNIKKFRLAAEENFNTQKILDLEIGAIKEGVKKGSIDPVTGTELTEGCEYMKKASTDELKKQADELTSDMLRKVQEVLDKSNKK